MVFDLFYVFSLMVGLDSIDFEVLKLNLKPRNFWFLDQFSDHFLAKLRVGLVVKADLLGVLDR